MKPSKSGVPVDCPAGSTQARGTRIRGAQRVSVAPHDPGRDRIVRRREVQRTTGLSRSSLYRLIASGSFPASIQLSANAVGWLEAEVSAWIADRVAASRGVQSRAAPAPEEP